MASTDVQIREDGLLEPPRTARSPTHRNLLLIWGGISGIISALAYGTTQGIPALADVLHSFPIEKTFLVRLAGFWIPALWPVFALFMVYVVHRLLEEGRARHVAYLGFLSGVVAFPIAVIHFMVQSTVHVDVSDLAASDPTFSPEVWNSVAAAVHGVDRVLADGPSPEIDPGLQPVPRADAPALSPEVTAAADAQPPQTVAPVSALPPGTVRYFEFTQGGSRKFWHVGVDGCELVVSYGRIGTDGQVKRKPFASPDAARRESERLIREKLAKAGRDSRGPVERLVPQPL